MKKNIPLMYAMALLQGMVFYGPIATLYRQAQGVSILQITVIESISLVLCLALELPWGIVADKIGYKRTMIFCCGLYFLSKIVFWQAAGFGMFLLERIMLSVVLAGLSGVDTSILYLSCGQEDCQRVFGIFNNLQTVGMLTAALVYVAAIGENYRLAGFLTVLSYGGAALLSLGLVEVRPPAGSRLNLGEFQKLLGQLLHNKRLLLLLVGIALLNETHQTITVFLCQPHYAAQGLSSAAIGCVFIAVTLAGMWGGCSARLTQRLGALPCAVVLYAAATAACLLLALNKGPVPAVLGVLLLRVSFSLFQPLQTTLQNRQVSTQNHATALSINAVVMESVGAATNVAFGKVAEGSLSHAFLLGGAFCGVGLLLFAAWYYGNGRHCKI